MPLGSLALVLHSHLPWVLHHGRWPHGVDWLNEAAAETYLPLWRVLHERSDQGSLGITLDLSPVLCEQLTHPDFQREFVSYLEQKTAAAAEDRAWFASTGEAQLAALAERWERFYRGALEDFMGPFGPNLVARFRRLEEKGAIEIITCGATHGYLPLLSSDTAAAGQVRTAVATHRRHFGRAPRGIWLPECAYRPAGSWTSPVPGSAPPVARAGIEDVLAAHGLRYFFVDRHLLAGGAPLGVYADRFDVLRHLARDPAGRGGAAEHLPYRPYRVGAAARVACFGRDAVTAVQVWSGQHGYPGDGAYLDFHKQRFPGGHRYWAVTHPQADLADKRPYDPGLAAARAPEHARHFVGLVEQVLRDAGARQQATPIVCSMYDTELFGHWWFEGPLFLAAVIDRARAADFELTTAGAHLDRHPPAEAVALPEGSWGDGGQHQVWLNERTEWTWRPVHAAERDYERLAREASAGAEDPLLDRLMRQAGRELLLLEASDWQFLITTFAARDYAELRLAEHADAERRLAALAAQRLAGGALTESDERFLAECEKRDPLFPDLDWRAYANPPAPVAAGGA